VPDFVIERLAKVHRLDSFDCGTESLNIWLTRFAWANSQSDSARVYVTHNRDNIVVGYHALMAGEISRQDAPERIGRGLAAHPIGIIVLGRLAVDLGLQGHGLGRALLQDALMRSEQAAQIIGVRAVMVQAINQQAREFYLRFGFTPTVVDEDRLLLLMKDLRAFLKVPDTKLTARRSIDL
jgi:GNAT superfamily N-acetyltransferase